MSEQSFRVYWDRRVSEVRSRLEAVGSLIAHPGTKGTLAEDALRSLIQQFLPTRFGVSRGFIMDADGKVSRQTDLLVYDQMTAAPMYQDPGFVILTPEMAHLAVECKLAMNRTDLRKACDGLRSVKQLNPRIQCCIWAYSGMSLGTLKGHLAEFLGHAPTEFWPDRIYNLERGYMAARRESSAAGRQWRVVAGENTVVTALLQAVFQRLNVRNLQLLVPEVPPESSEVFTI